MHQRFVRRPAPAGCDAAGLLNYLGIAFPGQVDTSQALCPEGLGEMDYGLHVSLDQVRREG